MRLCGSDAVRSLPGLRRTGRRGLHCARGNVHWRRIDGVRERTGVRDDGRRMAYGDPLGGRHDLWVSVRRRLGVRMVLLGLVLDLGLLGLVLSLLLCLVLLLLLLLLDDLVRMNLVHHLVVSWLGHVLHRRASLGLRRGRRVSNGNNPRQSSNKHGKI